VNAYRMFRPVFLACACATLAACMSEKPVPPPIAPVDRPLKVLMIGNSFSICALDHTPRIARAAGKTLDLVSLYIGGCELKRHWENVCVARTNETFAPYLVTYDLATVPAGTEPPFERVLKRDEKNGAWSNIPQMLAAEKWDIVTIQQASHQSWRPESYEPYAGNLVKLIREKAPQAQLFVQETWSYCNLDNRICGANGEGAGSWGFNQAGMYARLRANYADLAARYGASVIPTGTAVENVRAALGRAPVSDVVGCRKRPASGWADTIHFNGEGKVLQGFVWAGRLFGVDPRTVNYDPSLGGDSAARLGLYKSAAARALGFTNGK